MRPGTLVRLPVEPVPPSMRAAAVEAAIADGLADQSGSPGIAVTSRAPRAIRRARPQRALVGAARRCRRPGGGGGCLARIGAHQHPRRRPRPLAPRSTSRRELPRPDPRQLLRPGESLLLALSPLPGRSAAAWPPCSQPETRWRQGNPSSNLFVLGCRRRAYERARGGHLLRGQHGAAVVRYMHHRRPAGDRPLRHGRPGGDGDLQKNPGARGRRSGRRYLIDIGPADRRGWWPDRGAGS